MNSLASIFFLIIWVAVGIFGFHELNVWVHAELSWEMGNFIRLIYLMFYLLGIVVIEIFGYMPSGKSK